MKKQCLLQLGEYSTKHFNEITKFIEEKFPIPNNFYIKSIELNLCEKETDNKEET